MDAPLETRPSRLRGELQPNTDAARWGYGWFRRLRERYGITMMRTRAGDDLVEVAYASGRHGIIDLDDERRVLDLEAEADRDPAAGAESRRQRLNRAYAAQAEVERRLGVR